MENPIPSEKKPERGLNLPTVIIHGGAGAIHRSNLPPSLYKKYHASLLKYLESTQEQLNRGMSALDAACHAVSLLEDDPLFNCGRGSVFTTAGEIEMEASLMVATVQGGDTTGQPGFVKRTGAVSMVRNTRHPILLAKEVLCEADSRGGFVGADTMHGHLSGEAVEKWGWNERGLEWKDKDWFWTKKRWDEHRRGLGKCHEEVEDPPEDDELEGLALPSQGTVGAVVYDTRGNVAAATSTGGLTNKYTGRIGDTPTAGAGFWAESWDEEPPKVQLMEQSLPAAWRQQRQGVSPCAELANAAFGALADCIPSLRPSPPAYSLVPPMTMQKDSVLLGGVSGADDKPSDPKTVRRVVALSGTGNGDSFLRTNAARTTAAMCRFSGVSLQKAVTAVAGRGGELQKSAGDRWGRTGEGLGGMIGIEYSREDGGIGPLPEVVFDFNCGGMWRAYYEKDREMPWKATPKVMVFREEY